MDNKKTKHTKVITLILSILLILPLCFMVGCGKKEDNDVSSIDFTIVSGQDIPKELQKLIKERQKNSFELTYSEGVYLYIIKGYGKQKTGGYSITVNDFYLSNDNLIFDTDLSIPNKDDIISDAPSYPYIVIKTEYTETPVDFK